MTGRKKTSSQKAHKGSQKVSRQQLTKSTVSHAQTVDDSINSSTSDVIPNNIKKEQPPPPQTVRKIIKTENDEARALKQVFKSNPDSQMKDFIKKAQKIPPVASKTSSKLPADNHTPAVSAELLDTDDDVADNLARLFKASKSLKN